MRYTVYILRSAEKELDRLPSSIYRRINTKILSLEENPRPRGSKKLSGREQYRLRIGDYRVLYNIDDTKHAITIFAVGHRGEAYR